MTISFHDSRLRLKSEDAEIGDWDHSMYRLGRVDAGTFVLSAEGEDLTFRPSHPDEFAFASMNGGVGAGTPAEPRSEPDTAEQAPPPAKPLTLLLFYLLVAGTLGMAVWALTSIIS